MDKPNYLGQCDVVRRTPGGEEFWQAMMKNPQKISKDLFLAYCDPSILLDQHDKTDTFDNWLAGDPDAGFYRNFVNCDIVYFIQHSGFEFIWL